MCVLCVCVHDIVTFSMKDCIIVEASLRPSDAYMRQWTYQHWFRQWLVAWPAPSHYLNQCLDIVNWTLRIKLQWNFNRNSNIFIHENAFESIVCEMAAILSRPQCVKFASCLDGKMDDSVQFWYISTLGRYLYKAGSWCGKFLYMCLCSPNAM